MTLDDHGQPVDLSWNAARRADRTIHELLGLVKGIIIDGVVCEKEAELLLRWTLANPEASRMWPGDVIADRLAHIFHDGVADEAEREDLRYILENVTGGGYFAPDANPATRLPLDEPAPEIVFDGQTYVFTGRFLFGTRNRCQAAVEERGGTCDSGVTKRTSFVVIGDLGSRDWVHTSFGRKIQKAVEYKRKGQPLLIVSEEHWSRFVIQ